MSELTDYSLVYLHGLRITQICWNVFRDLDASYQHKPTSQQPWIDDYAWLNHLILHLSNMDGAELIALGAGARRSSGGKCMRWEPKGWNEILRGWRRCGLFQLKNLRALRELIKLDRLSGIEAALSALQRHEAPDLLQIETFLDSNELTLFRALSNRQPRLLTTSPNKASLTNQPRHGLQLLPGLWLRREMVLSDSALEGFTHVILVGNVQDRSRIYLNGADSHLSQIVSFLLTSAISGGIISLPYTHPTLMKALAVYFSMVCRFPTDTVFNAQFGVAPSPPQILKEGPPKPFLTCKARQD